jgi:hypothetical protein
MSQFRPGQRVSVEDNEIWDMDGEVLGVHSDGSVKVAFPDCAEGVWFRPDDLTLIPLPGIPAHLVRTPATDAARHWPVWRAA